MDFTFYRSRLIYRSPHIIIAADTDDGTTAMSSRITTCSGTRLCVPRRKLTTDDALRECAVVRCGLLVHAYHILHPLPLLSLSFVSSWGFLSAYLSLSMHLDMLRYLQK